MNPDLIDYSIDPAVKVRFEKQVKPKLTGKEPLLAMLYQEIKKYLKVSEPSSAD